MQWELAGSLFLGWLIVYLIIRRGLHQSGYIIWFTALFPYVVMLTLLAKALTLEGAIEGLKAYVHVSSDIDLTALLIDLSRSKSVSLKPKWSTMLTVFVCSWSSLLLTLWCMRFPSLFFLPLSCFLQPLWTVHGVIFLGFKGLSLIHTFLVIEFGFLRTFSGGLVIHAKWIDLDWRRNSDILCLQCGHRSPLSVGILQ